jgi:lipopolysaccharide export LptBFGC system permease protein LptF
MNPLTDIAVGAIGKVIESVGNAADQLLTSDDERNKAEIEMRRIDADVYKAELADTDSARKMQVAALQQDDVFSKRFVYYFSIAWSLFAMAFMGVVTLMDIPDKNASTVSTILGFLLGTAVASIFSFFLGTSRSSQNKDATIAHLSANK